MSNGLAALKIGSFYWVRITHDRDTSHAGREWMYRDQPARYAGRDERGEGLWHLLGVEDAQSCEIRWVGAEIKQGER